MTSKKFILAALATTAVGLADVAVRAQARKPRYIGHSAVAVAYAEDAVTGKILACRKVKLACQRFLDELKREGSEWRWKYDQDKANLVCSVFELFPHVKGEKRGTTVVLEPWQCFIFCNLFGWVNAKTGFRRFREALVMVPRGNGKSPMGAWVANYMAWFDGEKGSEVYCAATGLEQGFEVFRPAKAIVEMMGLDDRFGIVVPKGDKGTTMYQPDQMTRLQVIIGIPKDGKAPHCVVNDEYHQQQDNLLYQSLKRGMNKRNQSLMFNITTAGDTIEGPCYRMAEDIVDMLEGRHVDERTFGVIYDVDEGVDWLSEQANIMSNPNHGVSINAEAMADDQNKARRDKAEQMQYRCKNQNYWAQSAFGWMNMASWDACKSEIKIEDFAETPCYHGSDLASTLDISATVRLFAWTDEETGKNRYAAFCRGYLPEKQVLNPARAHFQDWADEGWLTVTQGAAIDYQVIEDDTVTDLDGLNVREMAYDARYAGQYAQGVQSRTGVEIIVVPPSPVELSPAMSELEAAVEDGRFEHDGNPLLRWCMANVVARKNLATGNYQMPGKDRPEKKIDAAVALLIAMSRARLNAGSGYITADDLVFA